MKTITKYLVALALILSMQFINAQDTLQNSFNKEEIIKLIEFKEVIKEQEKDILKNQVLEINKKLDKGEITSEEAENFKKEAAKTRALNIENRIAIVNNRIALLGRNEEGYDLSKGDNKEESEAVFRIGGSEGGDTKFVCFGKPDNDKPKNIKYDRRTSSDFVLAFGLNNAIIEGEKLDDSPYKFGGSRFFEIGWAWKTRVFKESNFMRFKYGYSFQFNGLKPIDNQYFVQQGNETILEAFPENLKKSKLTISNLVFPMHFEFGPSKKITNDNYFRYSTDNQFKIGIGGYGGFNIGTRQKLKYELDGDTKKDKQKQSFNTSNLVYGLSSYVAFDQVALYVKYDLSPIFKDQAIKQNNISIGLRFDMD